MRSSTARCIFRQNGLTIQLASKPHMPAAPLAAGAVLLFGCLGALLAKTIEPVGVELIARGKRPPTSADHSKAGSMSCLLSHLPHHHEERPFHNRSLRESPPTGMHRHGSVCPFALRLHQSSPSHPHGDLIVGTNVALSLYSEDTLLWFALNKPFLG